MAEILLLLVAMVWGTSYGLTKQALLFYPVLGFLAVRFCLTAALLLPAAWRDLRQHPVLALRVSVPLGLMLLGIFLCETFGVAHTSAAHAAFLISLCVVMTPFVEWVLLGSQPPLAAFIAAGASLAGTMLLTDTWHVGLNLGDILMLGAAVLRAVLVCMTKRLVADKPLSTLGLIGIQTSILGLGCLGLAALLPGQLPRLPHAPQFWLITLYLVLFCTLFAFFAQTWGIRRCGPTRATLLVSSEPLFGALFAMVWLGERLTTQGMLGGTLILTASLWAALPKRTNAAMAAEAMAG